MSDLDIRVVPFDSPDAQLLIAEVQQEYIDRYGAIDRTPTHPEEFAPPTGAFLIGYLDAEPVATGGLRRHDDHTVEVKRMYVRLAYRGRGLSRLMLAALEEQARAIGAGRVVLETGPMQPEAIGLYESSGFTPASVRFGEYADDPGARYYEKSVEL